MSTPSYHQTLLNPTKTKTSKKILFFTLSIVTLISLSYLGLVTIQANNPKLIKTLSLCEKSHDPTYCSSLINQMTPNVLGISFFDTRKLLSKILSTHSSDITKAIYVTKRSNYNNVAQEIKDCQELMDLSRDRINDSIKTLSKYDYNYVNSNNYDDNNVRTWLSSVLTNHVTCLDQLENNSNLLGLNSIMQDLISKARVLLAIHTKVSSTNKAKIESKGVYPTWVRKSDRKLLEVTGSEIVANAVVAKDGSGNYKTVGEALAGAPDRGKERYVIYVKKGLYVENVEVGKKKKNVMLIGDGMDVTIISGSENVVDGNTTFKSATLAAVGDGFILQDICIQNTAGPEKHQAVALRVGADQSVINRCKIDAYQDTLYTHSQRQFYTNSVIKGTVDFIFGNAAVVFQNSQLIARKPLTSQKNMVTAQGRTDPNQNTGTVIQYCDIIADEDLKPVVKQFPTYLGRPWKDFSRTVVMQSNIDDHIDQTGWFPWDGDFALDTLYYGEYKNFGTGSGIGKRVNWTGYRTICDASEAKQFTVGEFIDGQAWLNAAGVNFVEGL